MVDGCVTYQNSNHLDSHFTSAKGSHTPSEVLVLRSAQLCRVLLGKITRDSETENSFGIYLCGVWDGMGGVSTEYG